MGDRADLHLHSCWSDGRLEPVELVTGAAAAGLRAVSLTDHDTLSGWADFVDAGERKGLEVIPGVELSSRMGDRDTHILGYYVRPEDDGLLEALDRFREARFRRARKIVERLNAHGVPLSFDEVTRIAGEGVYGRPHVADALYQTGLTATYEDAFRRYIGSRGPAYVPKPTFSPGEAIALIHRAGGLAVLAHPAAHYRESEIRALADMGLDGVEIIHPTHSHELIESWSAIAERTGLFKTGGSDYHGEGRGEAEIGNPAISYEFVMEMRRHL